MDISNHPAQNFKGDKAMPNTLIKIIIIIILWNTDMVAHIIGKANHLLAKFI
jgi:hypothetical protein